MSMGKMLPVLSGVTISTRANTATVIVIHMVLQEGTVSNMHENDTVGLECLMAHGSNSLYIYFPL